MGDSLEKSIIHPRAYLYKIKENKLSQHERRIKYLEEQKEKRQTLTDKNRDLCDLFIKQIEKSCKDEEMEYESTQIRKESQFHFKLMMTEWFTDIPDDLEDNWFIKLVPEGFRILLIARNHHTFIYNKNGRYLFQIRTNFPGGGGCIENGTAVLDCVMDKKNKIVFVLDCLFWNSMSTLDSEANFRFYWLKSKFQENPEMGQYLNYKFVLMDSVCAERSLIQEKMFQSFKIGESEIIYDGIAFYHKESQYSFGYSPLATWLASYMLPEKLGIDVPEIYSEKKPKNYVNLQHYIENEKLFHKKKRRFKKTDVEDMES
ncbi:unnamed protein product [Psylliodes chrysocephalus]|uniref:Snurportin-1 n=1 Tax=Psylliodes chrysocephalus TaxID=3402493 RepID=A0A9P0CEA6_9CUCU|nr:unnamed protein product [Psylliodes chrysocephala]